MTNNTSNLFDKPNWSLSRLYKVLPEMPEHFYHVLPTLIGKPFDNAFREWIMVAVAVENRSWSCQFAHTAFSRLAGVSEDEVQALLAHRYDKLSPSMQAIVDFVRDLVNRDFVTYDNNLYTALGKYFTKEQREAIFSTAHVMNFFNRFGNTCDAACADLLYGSGHSGLNKLDLIVISACSLLEPFRCFRCYPPCAACKHETCDLQKRILAKSKPSG